MFCSAFEELNRKKCSNANFGRIFFISFAKTKMLKTIEDSNIVDMWLISIASLG